MYAVLKIFYECGKETLFLNFQKSLETLKIRLLLVSTNSVHLQIRLIASVTLATDIGFKLN